MKLSSQLQLKGKYPRTVLLLVFESFFPCCINLFDGIKF